MKLLSYCRWSSTRDGAVPPANEQQRVSRASGAGRSGVPASERVGGSGAAKPPGKWMIGRRHAVLVLAIACGAAAAAQQPTRDPTRATAGTASISGTVFVAGEPKQPARRVRVTLTNVARSSPGQTTTTDDSGAFA
ncbi:MAG TPA: hypothetical protein VNC21_07375, partial [Vicinamibacterales bacterium]|nr:hypothetical protein [Vicinamibacterales bacterium]